MVVVWIGADRDDEAALTIAGMAEDEVEARELQLALQAVEKLRPALGRHGRAVDPIDVARQVHDWSLHSRRMSARPANSTRTSSA